MLLGNNKASNKTYLYALREYIHFSCYSFLCKQILEKYKIGA